MNAGGSTNPVTFPAANVQPRQFLNIGRADDPQGVQSVCFYHGVRRSSTSGGIGQRTHFAFVPTCAINASPGDIATTRRTVLRAFDMRYVPSCASGEIGSASYTI